MPAYFLRCNQKAFMLLIPTFSICVVFQVPHHSIPVIFLFLCLTNPFNQTRVGVEIPIGLRCRNAIHRNFGGVIPLIQRHSFEKNHMDRIPQNSFENPSIRRGLYSRRGHGKPTTMGPARTRPVRVGLGPHFSDQSLAWKTKVGPESTPF